MHPADIPHSHSDNLETFLLQDPRFVCIFGRNAIRQGRCQMLAIPECMSDGQDTIHQGVYDLVRKPDCDAVVFADPGKPSTHHEAKERTWDFLVEIYISCFRHSVIDNGPTDASLRRRMESRVWVYRSNLDAFRTTVFPCCKAIPIQVTAMGPLYDTDHPRFAPQHCYALVRYPDVLEAQKALLKTVLTMSDSVMERTEICYRGNLPYIDPNDPLCDAEIVRSIADELRGCMNTEDARLVGARVQRKLYPRMRGQFGGTVANAFDSDELKAITTDAIKEVFGENVDIEEVIEEE